MAERRFEQVRYSVSEVHKDAHSSQGNMPTKQLGPPAPSGAAARRFAGCD